MKHIVLQPSFYDKFECIGSDCKYNCCREWIIGVTKQELKNMKRKIHTEEFREIFEDAFEKFSFNIFDYIIKFDENKRCKFLDENGLCKIYQEMGPENMSLVCQIFPRTMTYYMGKYESFLDISCEEVIRLLLQEKDGIKLEVIEREVTDAEKNSATRIDAQVTRVNPILHYWTDFKILILGVLQNREYNFGERIVVLGMAIKKADEMLREGIKNTNVIPNYIQQFVADFNDSKNREIFDKLFENIDKSGRKRLFQYLFYHCDGAEAKEQLKIKQKMNEKVDVKTSFETEFQKTDKLNIEYNVEKYQQAMADFEEFIKGKEFLVNLEIKTDKIQYPDIEKKVVDMVRRFFILSLSFLYRRWYMEKLLCYGYDI
jgi:lysine-N-methylase